jgi:hypothetical protein
MRQLGLTRFEICRRFSSMTTTAPLQPLQTFRHKLLGVFSRRADALFELIAALLLTVDPRSPVELSRSPAFRRRFSIVYNAMQQGQVEPEQARHVLPFANPALATAGSGDVLAGAIVGLLAQGLAPFKSAICGAFLHGLAGELTRRDIGEAGVVAGDVLTRLPAAIRAPSRP